MNFRNMQKKGAEITKIEILSQKIKITRAYRKALRESKKKIKAFWKKELKGIPPEEWSERKMNSLLVLLGGLTKTYKSASVDADKNVLLASRVGLSNNFYRQYYTMSWFTPSATKSVILPFQYIDPLAIQLSVFGKKNRISSVENTDRKKILDGMVPDGDRPNLNSVLNKNNKDANNRVRDAVTVAFLKGDSAADAVSDVKDSYNTINNLSQRVVDTESHRNVNAGFYLAAAYVGLKSITARVIQSVLDSQTRPQSVAVDNQSDQGRGYFIYPGGVKVSYPGNSGVAKWDINDRETTIMSILGVENTTRFGRNPATGKKELSTFKSYDEWAKKNNLKKNVYYQPITKPEVFKFAEAQI